MPFSLEQQTTPDARFFTAFTFSYSRTIWQIPDGVGPSEYLAKLRPKCRHLIPGLGIETGVITELGDFEGYIDLLFGRANGSLQK